MKWEKINATVSQVMPSCLPEFEIMSLSFAFLLLTQSFSLNETESIDFTVKDNWV